MTGTFQNLEKGIISLIHEKELHPEAPWCHQPADRKCHTLNQVGDYVYITGGQYM